MGINPAFIASINTIGIPSAKEGNINSFIVGKISKFYYNQYTYQNLELKGKISSGLFNIFAKSIDKNLQLNLASSGSFKTKYPTGKLNLDIAFADLQKINLVKKYSKLKGN